MRIAVIGTHSTGKTTLTSQMFAYASKNGLNAHYIHEVARSCPLPLNEAFNVEAATWIASKQMTLEIEARAKKYDFIICDRSCFDPIVYAINKFGYEMKSASLYRNSMLYKYAQHVLESYDTIINVRPSSHEIKSDGIRSTDPEFQKDIYELFEQELKYLKIGFVHYKDRVPFKLHNKYHFMNSDEVFNDDLSEFFEYIFHKGDVGDSFSSGQLIYSCPSICRG